MYSFLEAKWIEETKDEAYVRTCMAVAVGLVGCSNGYL
jgi:hypothetical protein